VTKHSQDQTAEEATGKEDTPVPADTDTDAEKVEDTVAAESTETADGTEKGGESTETADEATQAAEPAKPRRRIQWARVFVFGVLPAVALLLALGAGYLKWMDNSVRANERAGGESVQAATDSTIALLSYKPETVEQQLTAARDRLTGDFRDSYTSLTTDVVIPGAKQKQISAVATVPAAAVVSANPRRAVVLVFVNQTVIVGQDAPTDTASSVRVTLDKVGDRWLISKFDPV
jgi:Mce-associated membrane protein